MYVEGVERRPPWVEVGEVPGVWDQGRQPAEAVCSRSQQRRFLFVYFYLFIFICLFCLGFVGFSPTAYINSNKITYPEIVEM